MSTVFLSTAVIAAFVAFIRQTIRAEDFKRSLRRERERVELLQKEHDEAEAMAVGFQRAAQRFEECCKIAEDAREDAERRAAMAHTKALALELDNKKLTAENERLTSLQASPFADVSDKEMRNFLVYDGTGKGQKDVNDAE